MTFCPQFLATGIGSVPFEDPDRSVALVLEQLPEAPMWPQLPKRDLNEQMEIQYSEGIPRVVVDRERARMAIDTSGDYSEAFAEFYEAYMVAMDPDDGTGDCSALRISPAYAAGLHALAERLELDGGRRPFVKVQTTGPCSFGLTIVDENKRSVFYNEEFRDVVVKALAMKCRWQIQRFARFAERVICFIDEPILSAFGSSTYVSVTREEIIDALREIIEAIHCDGALAGIHCCGNTDWSIPIEAGADIVNFDAYDYGETILMYADDVKALFDRGGALAWGIVPTSEAIRSETAPSLCRRLDELIAQLAGKGVDGATIRRQALITPACGTGSMQTADAEAVFAATAAVSQQLRNGGGR